MQEVCQRGSGQKQAFLTYFIHQIQQLEIFYILFEFYVKKLLHYYFDYVTIDPTLVRPSEVPCLLGDPKKAKDCLGWEPQVSFDELIGMMVDWDLKRYVDSC